MTGVGFFDVKVDWEDGSTDMCGSILLNFDNVSIPSPTSIKDRLEPLACALGDVSLEKTSWLRSKLSLTTSDLGGESKRFLATFGVVKYCVSWLSDLGGVPNFFAANLANAACLFCSIRANCSSVRQLILRKFIQ
jgi:hypothetical protein